MDDLIVAIGMLPSVCSNSGKRINIWSSWCRGKDEVVCHFGTFEFTQDIQSHLDLEGISLF